MTSVIQLATTVVVETVIKDLQKCMQETMVKSANKAGLLESTRDPCLKAEYFSEATLRLNSAVQQQVWKIYAGT